MGRLLLFVCLTLCWQLVAGVATRSPCPRASIITTNNQYRGELHFICLQVVPNSKPRLDVIQYANQRRVWSNYVDDYNTNQLASFVDVEGNLRMLLAVPTKINGTTMYSIDSAGNQINETHTVNTQYVSTLAIWRLELNWEWHLAIANEPYLVPLMEANSFGPNKRVPLPVPGTTISIHSWRSTYFDRYSQIDLPYGGRVNKLEPMHINDQEFLIIAMEPSDSSHRSRPINSLIYKLDFGDGTFNWRQYQTLDTKLAIDASSFLISHRASFQMDYYIAIVGQQQQDKATYEMAVQQDMARDRNNKATSEHGLIIYKYFGDQFVKTLSIPVAGATKLEAISYGQGDSYVVIAILSGWSGQISLFLFDGLTLRPLPSPQHGVAPARAPPQPSQLHKRTMDSSGLHLFQIPTQQTSNDSSVKRTLDEVAKNLGLPALAFSSVGDDDLVTNTLNSSNQDTLYPIPVHEHLDQNHDDQSHTKRNFVDHFAGGQPGDNGNRLDLLGWCRAQINSLLGDKFELAAHQLSLLPRVDQPRPIEIMGDLIIEGDLHISNLLYANNIDDGRAPIELGMPLNTTQTFERIELTNSEIDSLKNRVDQILVDDGTIQEVYSTLRFNRLVFECLNPINTNPRLQPMGGMSSSCPQVGELQTDLLNRRSVSDIKRQALLTGRSMTVGQEVRFEHLVLRGQTNILSTLNKLKIEDIIFGRGRKPAGTIFGHKNFLNGLYSTSNINAENWNGARIDRHTIFTSTGEQRIEANLKFSRIVLDSMPSSANSSDSSRIELLNGLHLDAHLNQIAQMDDDNKFSLPIAFDELVINGPSHFAPKSQLSHVHLEDQWVSTLFGHMHQNITAPMEFQDVRVSYGGDIYVEGPVNGLTLVPDNVMMRNRNYDLLNQFVFDADLSVRLLQVEKALNGIQVALNTETHQYELAILYDGGKQMLTGIKILNEVQLGGYNNIAGLINGHLNITQLSQLARNSGEPFRFASVNLTGKQIRVASNTQMQVESSVNGIPANEICALANRLMQTPASQQQSYNRLKFDKQLVTFKQLKCASINGFNDLRGAFLMKQGNQRVSGTLRLVNGVVFNSTVNIGATFNNLNIRPLARAITQKLNESRTGHKDFYGDLYIDDLFANSINELQLANVFLAKSDQPQIIRAPMSFDHLDIENVLIVGRELMSHSFNGLNVSDIITNTLQYDAPQVIYNHVELEHLHILPGSNLLTKSLNGHDIRQLYSDAVLVDVGQQILAPKTFKNQADLTNGVSLRFGIDGLSENELKFNLLLQSDELIEDDLEFNNDVTIMKSLEIQTGQINDMDVNLFLNSMLYEERSSGFRVLGPSSLRFQNVSLNDLVVTGTIQGYDLSRDALQRSDNSNGSYDSAIRQEQILRNNQQMFNRLYNSGSTFTVQTRNRNETFLGSCHIHSCPQTTPIISLPPAPGANTYTTPAPKQIPQQFGVAQLQRPAVGPLLPVPWAMNRLPQAPPQRPNVPVSSVPFVPMMPRPMALVNTTMIPQIWRPLVRPPTPIQLNNSQPAHEQQQEFALVDPRYLDYQANLKARAIRDLALRVNRFLSVSFYYEIVQKHPLIGPVLHAAQNPIPDEKGYPWLLIKAASKRGEPCLQRGQKIDVMIQQRSKGTSFTIDSHIQETSSPSFVESAMVGNSHYLFVTELQPDVNIETMSHILVYIWNYRSGMYDLRQRIAIDGFPTALKAFVVDNRVACIALANPRVLQSSHSGAPLLYCQQAPSMDFNQRIVLNMTNIFDLDIVPLPSSNGLHILIAALSQQDTEQVGDLVVSRFDFSRRQLANLITRRTARPLKVHFVKQHATITNLAYNLVVSEGITSNDAAQATTRIFSVNAFGPRYVAEVQVIRDNQFADIQSVLLDNQHPMIFMRSTHSISIYAPMPAPLLDSPGGIVQPTCAMNQLQLVQRLPTKGANKFLVFNSLGVRDGSVSNATTPEVAPFGHYLVLSRDDCAHQQYSTLILRPRFT
uniref:Chondroitin sulfate proteoglycan 4 n=1 Tax=Aceria tosichella TaxID=561515 RepID=A0A6G1S987_9ACAR